MGTSSFKRCLSSFVMAERIGPEKMVAKLAEMGLPLPWDRVLEVAGAGSVGRPHVAQVMLECGYVSSLAEGFLNYIGRNAPAYVRQYKLTPAEAVQMIRGVGGLPRIGASE